jgi:6-phosphogluconolactonase
VVDGLAPSLVVSDAPGEDAGGRVAAAVRDALARSGSARLAVPGGSAASALGAARRALAADGLWAKLSLTWVDERCVPSDDPASNRGAAYRAGHLDASAPPGHELALFEAGETPAQACARVGAALAAHFASGLDVVLLGLGEDGHVASLFPGHATPIAEPGALVAHVPDSPKPPPRRITLTRRALASARTTIVLATGEGKRDALARLLAGDAALPALGLPGLTLVTDLADLGGRA